MRDAGSRFLQTRAISSEVGSGASRAPRAPRPAPRAPLPDSVASDEGAIAARGKDEEIVLASRNVCRPARAPLHRPAARNREPKAATPRDVQHYRALAEALCGGDAIAS